VKSSAPDVGWFGYAPLTSKAYSNQFTTDMSTDLWVLGLQVLGVSSVVGSLNFIVTIINLRAPGMTMMRLPVFTWMTLDHGLPHRPFLPSDHDRSGGADDGPVRSGRASSRFRTAACRFSGSTCSGSSAIPRCTS
jgi:hypothetical protein